ASSPGKDPPSHGADATGTASVHAVKSQGAAGQYLVPCLGRQRPETVADHLRRAGEESVLMRIIGRPHDLVRPDIAGQRRNTALARLDRDPAVALDELDWTRLRGVIIVPVVVEM